MLSITGYNVVLASKDDNNIRVWRQFRDKAEFDTWFQTNKHSEVAEILTEGTSIQNANSLVYSIEKKHTEMTSDYGISNTKKAMEIIKKRDKFAKLLSDLSQIKPPKN